MIGGIQNDEILETVEVFKFIQEDKVIDCLFGEKNIWISLNFIEEILGDYKEEARNAFEKLGEESNEFFVLKGHHKYFFPDGNRRGYKSNQTNFYDIEAVTALSVKLNTYKLFPYISRARAMLFRALSGVDESYAAPVPERRGLVSCNVFSHLPREVIVPHSHSCYEVTYYTKGSGTVSGERGTFEFRAGTLFLASPQSLHEEYVTEESECICLAFYSEEKIPTAVVSPTEKNAVNLKMIYSCLLEILHKGISDLSENENSRLLVVYWLKKLIIPEDAEKRYSDDIVDYVKKYIDGNYRYKINFAILSEKIGYSLSRLNALFRQKEGQPLYTYLSNVRMLKAKELLRGSTEKISAISKACGFSGTSRFSQFFKERTGVSPLVYRKISNSEVEDGVLKPPKERVPKEKMPHAVKTTEIIKK